jgi:hypothetical protein
MPAFSTPVSTRPTGTVPNFFERVTTFLLLLSLDLFKLDWVEAYWAYKLRSWSSSVEATP